MERIQSNDPFRQWIQRGIAFIIAVICLLAACGTGTVGDIRDIEFADIDEIELLKMEQAEQWTSHDKVHLRKSKEVSDFVTLLKSSAKIKKLETPFPLGDGVITLIAGGSNQYAFRYYLDTEQLLDLHKGMLYRFPDGLAELLREKPHSVDEAKPQI